MRGIFRLLQIDSEENRRGLRQGNRLRGIGLRAAIRPFQSRNLLTRKIDGAYLGKPRQAKRRHRGKEAPIARAKLRTERARGKTRGERTRGDDQSVVHARIIERTNPFQNGKQSGGGWRIEHHEGFHGPRKSLGIASDGGEGIRVLNPIERGKTPLGPRPYRFRADVARRYEGTNEYECGNTTNTFGHRETIPRPGGSGQSKVIRTKVRIE